MCKLLTYCNEDFLIKLLLKLSITEKQENMDVYSNTRCTPPQKKLIKKKLKKKHVSMSIKLIYNQQYLSQHITKRKNVVENLNFIFNETIYQSYKNSNPREKIFLKTEQLKSEKITSFPFPKKKDVKNEKPNFSLLKKFSATEGLNPPTTARTLNS